MNMNKKAGEDGMLFHIKSEACHSPRAPRDHITDPGQSTIDSIGSTAANIPDLRHVVCGTTLQWVSSTMLAFGWY